MNALIIFALAALAASAGANCPASNGQTCLTRSQMNQWWSQNGDFPSATSPCMKYNGKYSCFTAGNGNMLSNCDCSKSACDCPNVAPTIASECNDSSVPKNPDCSATKNAYKDLNGRNGDRNTQFLYCGVDTAKCGPVCFRGNSLSNADKKMILRLHNEKRLLVAKGLAKGYNGAKLDSASNMRELKWDDDLASGAQLWADQCPSGHDKVQTTAGFPDYVGQNIAWSWNSAFDSNWNAGWEGAMSGWYNSEIVNFRPATRGSFAQNADGSVIGHFTQVVWAETTRVGCGAIQFYDEGRKMYTKTMVCNYGKGGNMRTAQVYKKGSPASACPAGKSSAFSGLCN